MSRKEYMEQLDMLLRDIPHTERQEALKYYEDYFEDAGEDHEADVIEELGSPEELAKKLREDLKREESEGVAEDREKKSRERESRQAERREQPGGANQQFTRESQPFGNGQKGNARQPKKPRKGYKALNVCFIVLGIIFGIVYLARLTGGIVWVTSHRYIYNSNGELPDSFTTETYNVEEDRICNLNIEAGVGELTIEYWDEGEISVSYPDAYMEVERDGEELSLETKDNWFWRNLFRIWNDGSYQVVIKIPSGYIFDEVEISTGAGTTNIERLETDSLYLSTGAGELNADKIIVMEDITIEAGVGETTIHNLQAKKADFSIGVGELYIGGRVDGDITADCGVGELNMELSNRETDFNYDISCGVGEVNINGKSYSGIGRTEEKNNDASYDFDISCGVGEIKVTLLGRHR